TILARPHGRVISLRDPGHSRRRPPALLLRVARSEEESLESSSPQSYARRGEALRNRSRRGRAHASPPLRPPPPRQEPPQAVRELRRKALHAGAHLRPGGEAHLRRPPLHRDQQGSPRVPGGAPADRPPPPRHAGPPALEPGHRPGTSPAPDPPLP